jgi:CRP/FNR family transcriptional regulator
LEPTDLADLESVAVPQRFVRGAYIYRAGAPGSHAYLLRSGMVKIHQLSPTGREVILWFCLAGEIFGLAEVTRGGERAVNAQACTELELLAVPQARFREFLAGHPDAALLAMQVLSSRMRALGEIFVNLVSDDVNTRIAKLIVRLAAHYGTRVGKDIVLNIPLTHQEIADMVGTSRQTVTSSFSALNRQGVLSINNHRICIESQELLSELTHDTL